ncbi:MAG: hypothetical protein NC111_05675 [Bacteroides sp.]|nr:hypothetical protein [Bacteroides sp.]MCM1413315.1 hypothetical protein [Bacteroides sp.]MCM1471999.1 hypothetical protein [Bacteroides sp.]
MSILSSFKKALGFPDEYDDDLDDLISDPDHEPEINRPVIVRPVKTHIIDNDTPEAQPTTDKTEPVDEAATIEPMHKEIPDEVFDAVIKLFNEHQPEFVRDCLSLPQQRAWILQRVDESLRQALKEEAENARRIGDMRCNAERRKMSDEIERFKSEYHQLKQQQEEFKSSQLSATRQKRALGERIHDLENQVSRLEADNEQLQLEIRSMSNRLRVAGARSNAMGEDQSAIDAITAENDKLTQQVAQLQSELETARQNTLADDQIESLKEMEKSITQFEQIKKKKDRKIRQLSEQIMELQATTTSLNEALAKARSESNRGEVEELRAEIKRLTQLLNASAEQTPHKSKPGRKKRRTEATNATAQLIEIAPDSESASPKISAIDELMDSTDWFTVAEPLPPKKDPEIEEEFGYKEPPRKSEPDNDNQLLLFDL